MFRGKSSLRLCYLLIGLQAASSVCNRARFCVKTGWLQRIYKGNVCKDVFVPQQTVTGIQSTSKRTKQVALA